MADENGNGLVERIALIVEAPNEQINSPNSGLNIAIARLEQMQKLLKQVGDTYSSLARALKSETLVPPPVAGSAPSRASAGRPTVAGNVKLEIAGDQVKASLAAGQTVSLLVPAAQVKAAIPTGQVITLEIPAAQVKAEAAVTATASSGQGGKGGSGGKGPSVPQPSAVPGSRLLSTRTVTSTNVRQEVFAIDELNTVLQTLKTNEKGERTEIIETKDALRAKQSVVRDITRDHAALNDILRQQFQTTNDPVKRLELQSWAYQQLAESVALATKAQKANLDDGILAKLAKQESDFRLKSANLSDRAALAQQKQAEKLERDRIANTLNQARKSIAGRYGYDVAAAGGDEMAVAAAQLRRQKALANLYYNVSQSAPSATAQELLGKSETHRARAYLSSNQFDTLKAAATEQGIKDQVRKANLRMAADFAQDLHVAGDDRTRAREARMAYHSNRAAYFESIAKVTSGEMSEGFSAKALGEWQKAQAIMGQLSREAKRTAEATSYIGRNMVENVAKVTAWTTSVGLLYGSLRLARSGMQSLIEVGHQSARLSQVLNGSANEAARLTDEVMSLAAANGRSNQEAMESAIAWSRLGLRRVQVAEAVRVSLLAANVAEITAAEATEHLSSLMVVYNLRASELGAVLGMLNNVTNTYNVTNKDLLTGLTRTAAIAKQAGIPLAELIGLLGAGVGATGQTGANIGNAIKSVIGSLSDEGKLKALRETFHFEGTRGMTGELKNMSQLLSEFWVAYVRMGQAERQSALFTVAGKNQASRMAALLDNYVRAQTLAISAQLNLNSAEQENARIKATLRNQLVGLVSEWQRFINLQGNRGPVQMLSQMTVALKNLIRVANAPGWNVAATGLLGLTGAVGAKMALTGYTLAQHQAAAGTSPVGRDKRSILVNTAAALGREMGVVKNVLAEMAVNGGWIWGNRKPAALLGMSEYARDAAGNLHKFSAAAGGAGVNMVRLGAGAKAARIAMAGFSDVLLPLLAITAALYGINWIMEKIGVSTDKAEDRISRLGESAQRASAAAESGEMRGRLFRTVERAFVAPETTQRTRVSLVNQLTEAYAPYEAGDDEAAMRRKDQIRERRRREGEAIARTANESERNARARQFFGQLEAESLDARNRQRRLARDRLSDQIAEIDATLRKPALSKAKRQELTEKRQGLTDQRITSLLQEGEENADAVERFKENSLEYKTAMEDQKKLLEEIRDLWNQLPGDTYLDKLNKQKLAAQQILEVGKAQLENLNQQVRQLGGIEMGYEEARARVAEENGAIRDERAKSKQKVLEAENAYRAEDAKYTNPFGGKLWQPQSVQGAYDKIQQAKVGNLRKQAELDQRQRANDRLEEQLSRVDTNTDAKRKMLERDEMRKRVQEAQVQIETLNNPARNAAAETMDRRAFALRYAGNEAVAWEIGETRAEQLAHRVGQLKLSYEAKEQLANSGVVQGIDAENLRLQALQQRVLYTEDLIRGEEMLVELGKEELNTMKQKTREYERSLLLAGPGELLRKLAVQSLSRDGMNAGQFLALDPSARQDWFSMPENSEEIRRIRRDRQALRNAGYGSRTMRQQQDLYVQGARERAGLMAQLRPEVPADIWEGARSAGASLANLANVATVLGGRFNELIRIITSYPGIRQVTVGPPPLAQNPNTR